MGQGTKVFFLPKVESKYSYINMFNFLKNECTNWRIQPYSSASSDLKLYSDGKKSTDTHATTFDRAVEIFRCTHLTMQES